MSLALKDIKSLVDSLEEELKVLDFARYHIRKHLDAFPPEELECMAEDRIITYEEIPPEKRTEFVKDRLRHVMS